MTARILVGTSGWNYDHWRGKFYEPKLAQRKWLEFYAAEFPTTEVNYSFYRLPKAETFAKWKQQVPSDFVFACKASRYLTHNLKLLNAEESWQRVITPMLELGDQLGPVLLQFHEKFQKNYDRLAEFLEMTGHSTPGGKQLRLAFEFRHNTWLDDDIYSLLEQYGAAICVIDSNVMPRVDVVTAPFAYYRFHGRTRKYGSKYNDEELLEEATAMKKLRRKGIDVYAYFNNDARAYAIENARTLMGLVQSKRTRGAA